MHRKLIGDTGNPHAVGRKMAALHAQSNQQNEPQLLLSLLLARSNDDNSCSCSVEPVEMVTISGEKVLGIDTKWGRTGEGRRQKHYC